MSEPQIGTPGLWIRITHRFGVRMPEWFMSGHIFLFGFVLLIADGLFLQKTWSGFGSLLPWLAPQTVQFWMGLLMMLTGIARFGGLIVNGARKHVTPRIRQLSAAVGCMIWFGITYGFVSSDVLSTWFAIYPLFALEELININRAARDEGEVRLGKTA